VYDWIDATTSEAVKRMSDYGSLSFWHETAPAPLEPRPALDGDQQVDVAIVGAGYTGLWTAYYLKLHDPGIRIAILESEIAGFGASGRNGGWCLGLLAGMENHLANPARREGGIRLQRAMFAAVDEVATVCEKEAIDCHYQKGGTVTFASVSAHLDALRSDLESWRELGFGEEDFRWLDPDESAARVNARSNLGGILLTHCAAIHPTRLARGLAERVEKMGVAIYERSPVESIDSGSVLARGGRVRADVVVRAAEGYTRSIRGHKRALLPLHSMMIATEPLPESTWSEIGLAKRETFSDPRRMVIYGQRTADDRIAFGCRGAYYFGSDTHDRFPANEPAFEEVHRTLESLFPVLAGHPISHRWGGPLGAPRDWIPSVGLDRDRRLAWAGGYVGEGVAATNLGARCLADLILGRDSDLVTLPWVGHRSRRWEPEPIRWLGVSTVKRMGESLDAEELRERPPSAWKNAIFHRLVPK
jgi:glycine/D-amino acid oxidase-like deaminating enzyme